MARIGIFDVVAGHEPKNAPGNGLAFSLHWAGARPHPRQSGLASTTVVVTWVARVWLNMLTEPQDDIDPLVLDATDRLCAAYSGDFTLGGTVRDVDLLGQAGTPLSAQGGYLKIDSATYRTSDITLPLIVNDVWTQAP